MKMATQDYQSRKEFFRDRGARAFNLLSLEGQANAGVEVIEDMEAFLNEDQIEKLERLIEAAVERGLAEGLGAEVDA
jgi:hypothetical protein